MTFETRVADLATAIGADIKSLRLADGQLANLSTTAKNNLVAAINEVLSIANAANAAAGAQILDTAGDGVTDKTWSANKIHDELLIAINDLRTELTNGASASLDTFGELAAAMAADQTAAAALATSVSNRVRFDAAQDLTSAEKSQAQINIGAVSQGTVDGLIAWQTLMEAQTNTVIANLAALGAEIGNTDADFVATYAAAKV